MYYLHIQIHIIFHNSRIKKVFNMTPNILFRPFNPKGPNLGPLLLYFSLPIFLIKKLTIFHILHVVKNPTNLIKRVQLIILLVKFPRILQHFLRKNHRKIQLFSNSIQFAQLLVKHSFHLKLFQTIAKIQNILINPYPLLILTTKFHKNTLK